jgi:hypothetical protein
MYHFVGGASGVSHLLTGERMNEDAMGAHWLTANRLMESLMPIFGECMYCRDGVQQRLYSFDSSYVHAGDVIPEKEYVCRSCYNWKDKS